VVRGLLPLLCRARATRPAPGPERGKAGTVGPNLKEPWGLGGWALRRGKARLRQGRTPREGSSYNQRQPGTRAAFRGRLEDSWNSTVALVARPRSPRPRSSTAT